MSRSTITTLCVLALGLLVAEYAALPVTALAFMPRLPTNTNSQSIRNPNSYSSLSSSSSLLSPTTTTTLFAADKREVTLKELMKDLERNPEKYLSNTNVGKKSKRTRKKVTNPQQEYVYAAQKRRATGATTPKMTSVPFGSTDDNTNATTTNVDTYNPVYQARQLGLTNAASQHCDAPVAAVEPEIVGRIQIQDNHDTKASAYAYIIDKPAGWSIVGAADKKKRQLPLDGSSDDDDDDDGDNNVDDTTVNAVEHQVEQRLDGESSFYKTTSKVSMTVEEDGAVETIEWDATDMLAAMTPEEIEEFQAEGGFDLLLGTGSGTSTVNGGAKKATEKGTKASTTKASFEGYVRPSVVAWLKERKAEEGTPIRGGKFWTAVAGATNVDDSGLVVICPKDKVDSLFIDYAKYVAVVGSGQYLAAKPKGLDDVKKESTEVEVIAKLRRGRGDDTVLVVGLSIAEHFSTCNHVVQICQEKLQDGIRGDPASNPFDRRAPRRLIHCDAIAVSSLTCDDAAEVESVCLPDDIVVLAERRNNHEFIDGTFLGRTELLENPYTNAYREINGAADGFPGWNVDRYDKWLLVQHDDQYPRGPLPSIHDGNTLGVYYLPADPNRSMMGRAEVRPTLLEGQPAPDFIPIQENGVAYLAALDKDLSTGIFLDQRPQRAWLTRNCNSDTRVLNCFSHCGAFTVAAAAAGASTVSLDLNKKFLDRIPPQLQLNSIDFDDRHDTIFGDCFDWLARLAKRGELFDIIILDPPSTSIGIKKKRWSVKNDMAELVALAAPMVKKGGLLWTTTNSATIHPIKFAKMCKKGLDDVGLSGAKLERVVPMPTDFLCVGPQPVKNLVWRIP